MTTVMGGGIMGGIVPGALIAVRVARAGWRAFRGPSPPAHRERPPELRIPTGSVVLALAVAPIHDRLSACAVLVGIPGTARAAWITATPRTVRRLEAPWS
jgi:hypothetical protein